MVFLLPTAHLQPGSPAQGGPRPWPQRARADGLQSRVCLSPSGAARSAGTVLIPQLGTLSRQKGATLPGNIREQQPRGPGGGPQQSLQLGGGRRNWGPGSSGNKTFRASPCGDSWEPRAGRGSPHVPREP